MTAAFSPDNKTIAFIQFRANAGDDTDLFVFDMKTASIRE
jgi:Tol biopolymer transport system component